MAFGITYSFTPTPTSNYEEITDLWGKVTKAEETIKELQNKKENNMDWKDLDINNIPHDFFVNERYEVQRMCDGIWRTSFETPNKRPVIIENILNVNATYRYKIKSLAPMKMTELAYKEFNHFTFDIFEKTLEEKYGRPVEIID